MRQEQEHAVLTYLLKQIIGKAVGRCFKVLYEELRKKSGIIVKLGLQSTNYLKAIY